jgi:CheY-like chemotaxis protein
MARSSVTSFPTTVLVVDDERMVRRVVEEVLGQRGLTTVGAEDGERAIEELDRMGFGCMLVDKNLPGLDGIEVIRHGCKVQPFCASILMTAHASIDSAIEALRLGASDYLLKPFEDVKLIGIKVEQSMLGAQTRFENGRLLARIREMASDLNSSNEKLYRQKTEIEMFEQIMSYRMDLEAAEDRRRIEQLEREIAECRVQLPKLNETTRSMLARARAVLRNNDTDSEALKGALQQVVRVLDRNRATLEKLVE